MALFFAGLFLCKPAFAVDVPYFNFSRIVGYSNLASSYVTAMDQDTTGYIWIGSIDGINRFDGYDISVYRGYDSESEISLIGNQVNHLLIDSQNRVWVASPSGIALYNRELDLFVPVATDESAAALPDVYVRMLAESPSGSLITAVENTLYEFNKDDWAFQEIYTSSYGDISGVEFCNFGCVWISHFNGGGVIRVSRDDRYEVIDHYGGSDLDVAETDFAVLDMQLYNDYLFVAIENDGIARIDTANRKVNRYLHNSSERFVFEFYQDSKERLWACDYSGFKLYVEEDDYFYGYYHDPNRHYSVPPNIAGIFEDKQGNFYSFHNGNGVYVSHTQRGFNNYNNSDWLFWHTSDPNITAIGEDHKGNLWLGSFNGGIDIFNWDDVAIERISSTENESGRLGMGSVHFILNDSQNRLWVGTYNGGLHNYNFDNKSFESWRISNSGISHNNIKAAAEDKGGNLWLATQGAGVDYFDIEDGEFINYNHKNYNLSSNWVNDLVVDSSGGLWVATAYGLNYLSKGSDQFEVFLGNPDLSDKSSLHGNQILVLFIDSNDQIWIGANYGLYTYCYKDESFQRHDGNMNNYYITAIEEDQNGDMWISTQGGLHKYNMETGDTYYFGENDGLQADGFNLGASYFNNKDMLYFAGSEGVSYFNPDNVMLNNEPPEVVISKFSLFNEEVDEYGESSILDKHISLVDEVVLSYDQNFITFEFVALNMMNPLRNQYACMLKGFDNEFIDLGSRRSVTYTNLNPGEYSFTVIAANNDGVWNREGVTLDIIITPPWWRTCWFYLLVAFLLGLTVLLVIRLRTEQLNRQKVVLADEIARKTAKLRSNNLILKQRTVELNRINSVLEERQKIIEEQSEELENQACELQDKNRELVQLLNTRDKLFSIVAHDLRSPFNTIMGFSSLLVETDNNREEVIKYARLIYNSSVTVYNLLDNLLYWARSQVNEIDYKPVHTSIDEILVETLDIIRNSAVKKGLIINDSLCSDYKIFGDVNMLKIVVRNLLMNAVKFTPRGGEILIKTEKEGDSVRFSVSDTGIGISGKEIDAILKNSNESSSRIGTEGEKGSGLGLVLVKEFIEKNCGAFYIESTLNRGSTFSFTIPLSDSGKK
ncbi:two-component regulator propeller domain-containing protein [Marinilabiliaceae bacterium ANBcel2]|nr:two-component regulator propeller domain-containing protein [Marinilabiliaceae bacterium ANBcel2]